MAEKCAHCTWKLKEKDIIEVCSVCNAKYHKDCFSFLQACKNCGAPFDESELQEYLKQHEKQIQETERQRQEEDARRLAEEQAHQKTEQEKYQARINHLKATGRDGYYEYKVISLVDKRGAVDIERLMNELNDLGLDGWRLQCAYTNEMGKDSLSIAGIGLNSTSDQNILIFERFVKFE